MVICPRYGYTSTNDSSSPAVVRGLIHQGLLPGESTASCERPSLSPERPMDRRSSQLLAACTYKHRPLLPHASALRQRLRCLLASSSPSPLSRLLLSRKLRSHSRGRVGVSRLARDTGMLFILPACRVEFSGLYDADQGAEYGFVFPPSTTGGEFIGEWVIPVANKWAGIALGGGMVDSLLVMAWPYKDTIVHSTRYATNYVYPTPYAGPVITTLPFTSKNATHWTWVFRCQNCTSTSPSRVHVMPMLNPCVQPGPTAAPWNRPWPKDLATCSRRRRLTRHPAPTRPSPSTPTSTSAGSTSRMRTLRRTLCCSERCRMLYTTVYEDMLRFASQISRIYSCLMGGLHFKVE
jgi:hypothetical protein